MNRIEQIITEIEEYIDNCKFQNFSSTKIIVNKDEIEELLAELRMKTPEEIKKYKKIIANTDAIIEDAKQKADAIILKANKMTEELISEHEIMQQAYSQANEIVNSATEKARNILDNATHDANEIRMGAMSYTDSILYDIEKILSYSIEDIDTRYEGLKKSLIDNLNIVVTNRSELNPVEETDQTNYGVNENDDYMEDDYDDEQREGSSEIEDYTVKIDF